MPLKSNTIPVIPLSEDDHDIVIAKSNEMDYDIEEIEKGELAHRHNLYIFGLQVSGTATFELDFQQHSFTGKAVMFVHPNQIHRLVDYGKNTFYMIAIGPENIYHDNLKLLEELHPVSPIPINEEEFKVIYDISELALKISERKNGPNHKVLVKNIANTFISEIIALYAGKCKMISKPSRFDITTRLFNKVLELHYKDTKRPAAYAKLLNISPAYLNECVRKSTGSPVSFHIQQRIILEAKRLLYHSNISVKEIATELGYDDYAYFSKLFTKVAGISAINFRKQTK